MADVGEAEVSRLRAEVQGLRDERLAYAWQEVARLRERLLEGKRVLRTAEPREPEHDDKRTSLVPVTSAELDAVLARLAQLKPLSVA